MKQVRTRFAPSPTGYLHIGSLRTALFCYLWAKKNNGEFLLRVEDTDRERLVDDAISHMIASLHWAGISPTEGVLAEGKQEGNYGPYIQSERLDIYREHANKLVDQKKAYKCYCTSERLTEMREIQRAAKQMPKYDRTCYHLSDEEKMANDEKNLPYVLRFFVTEGEKIAWNDAVFGKVEFDRDQVDDFIMIKADQYPTYNFANVVDDHLMEISHIIRGDEFLSSTPKHLLLYEAFGWEAPELVHVAPILGKGKKKLSKRDGDVAVDLYADKGFLPEALLNFVALLGWNPKNDQELFSHEEMIAAFDISQLQKSGAVLDPEKLEWMNGQYIRNLSPEEFTTKALPFLLKSGLLNLMEDGSYTSKYSEKSLNTQMIQSVLVTEQERTKRLDELSEKIEFFFMDTLDYAPEILIWKKGTKEDVQMILPAVIKAFEDLDASDFTTETIQSTLRSIVDETGKGVGDVFWPVRVALSGQERSPGPQEMAPVLGKENTIQRLQKALELIS